MRNGYFMWVWEEVGECGKELYFFLNVGRSGKGEKGVGECGLGWLSYEKNRALDGQGAYHIQIAFLEYNQKKIQYIQR